ncbi:MAG TPA: HsmA family protein [Longilinea sp.]|nr:HsmA family protein [Longilinea sp.]
MSVILIVAIVTISLALVCYSIGVWSEKFAGRLKPWHLVFFWIGFVFDTTGTTLMGQIAGGLRFNIHGVTGALAILLMVFHAIWATIVLVKKDDHAIQNFHKFSLVVWVIWLIPFLTGLFLAMR